MKKYFAVKLEDGSYLGHLPEAPLSELPNMYTRGEAIKKTKNFKGKIEPIVPQYVIEDENGNAYIRFEDFESVMRVLPNITFQSGHALRRL